MFSWLIRVFTRRAGQPLSQVPSHVGIQVLCMEYKEPQHPFYQMISTGIDWQPFAPYQGLLHEVAVIVPAPEAVEDFCSAKLKARTRYDWFAIALDVLGLVLPPWVDLTDRDTRKYDCSRFVAAALDTGGHEIHETHDPISPNQLYLRLTRK